MAGTREYTVGNETYLGHVYGPGTKAYIDGFGGMVPCTVIDVLKPCNGRLIGRDELKVRIDETMSGYHAGEVITCSAAYTPPRAQRILRGFHYRVNVNYIYEREMHEEAAGAGVDSG